MSHTLTYDELLADAVAVVMLDALEQLAPDDRSRLFADFLVLLARYGVHPPEPCNRKPPQARGS